tara:strand:+ start:28 stop:684 length:657 start_codon:yes stop_codon:yes gene_type:complete
MVAEQYPNIPGIPDKSELRLHHPYGVDSELLRAFEKEQVDLAFNQALPKLLKFVDAFAVYDDNDLGYANLDVSKFDNAPNMQFNYHADLFNDSDKYTVRLDGAIVFEMTISAGKREYSIPTGRYLSKVDFYKECKTTGEKVIDLINQLPRWIQLQKNYLKQKFIPVSLKPFAEILSVDIEEPNKKELNECPECYEYKPDDARVEKGMKCSECAYPGGA